MKQKAPKTGRPQGTTRREIINLARRGLFTYKDFQGTYNTFFQTVRKMVKRGEVEVVQRGRTGWVDQQPTVYALRPTMKYVIVKSAGVEVAILIPEFVNHCDVVGKDMTAISAGYCTINGADVKTYGESTSLKLKPREEDAIAIDNTVIMMGLGQPLDNCRFIMEHYRGLLEREESGNWKTKTGK